MMEHTCQGMTLGDHSKAICTICGADLSKSSYSQLLEAIKRVRELHKPYKFDVLVDLQACSECSQINRHGISVFSVLHPCPTIKALDGDK